MICILAGQIVLLAAMYGGLRWLDFWLSAILGLPAPAPSAAEVLLVFSLPLIGVWLATSPEPERIPSACDNSTRLAARILLAAFILLTLMAVLSGVGTAVRPATASDMRWMRLRDLLCCLLNSAAWIALCIHISPLSRRAGAHRLIQSTFAVGAGVAITSLISSGISAWFSMHVQQWVARTPSTTTMVLREVDWGAETLREVLVLLAAFLYRRFLRHQARLARSERHVPGTVAGP
jgi:hypothetical protein